MKINKLILSIEPSICDEVSKRFQLNKQESGSDDITLYSGINVITDDSENIILLSSDILNIKLGFIEVLENYEIDKVVLLGFAATHLNFDFNSGDVILPNTFISDESKEIFFLEYAIGQNYDLTQFGLILSGLCLSTANKDIEPSQLEEEGIDITDSESHRVLTELKKNNLLEKTVVIKGVSGPDDSNLIAIKNVVQTLELIL